MRHTKKDYETCINKGFFNIRFVISFFLLCSTQSTKNMEISYTTKKDTEKTALLSSRNYQYSSQDALQPDSFIDRFARLPQEIGIKIVRQLFALETRIINDREKKLDDLHHMVVFGMMLRAKEKCPLIIGNKTYQFKDLLTLTNQSQDELFSLAYPNQIYSYLTGFNNTLFNQPMYENTKKNICLSHKEKAITILQSQPDHIKKDLVIKIGNYTCSHLWCCIFATSGCLLTSGSASLSAWGSIPLWNPIVWAMPTTACGLAPMGYLMQRISFMHCCENCCKSEYSIDKDGFV